MQYKISTHLYSVRIYNTTTRAIAHSHAKEPTHAYHKYIEALVTIVVGGVNIDVGVLVYLKRFLEENCMACLCLVKRVAD